MNIAKTGAAFGLAALTLASSLSLGAAANAAPASAPKGLASFDTIDQSQDQPSFTDRPLIFQTDDGVYHPAIFSSRTANPAASLAEAKRLADHVSYDSVTRLLKITTGSQSGKCLIITNYVLTGNCTSSQGSAFIQDGHVVNGYGSIVSLLKDTGNYPYNILMGTQGQAGAKNATVVLSFAEATDIDVFERKAQIKGIGEPGATVVLQNKPNLVNKDGEWMAEVTGLKIGDNKFTAKQFDADGVEIEDGDIEFTVTVETTPLSADLVSTDTASGTAEIGGKATPGGVVLLDDKTEIPVDKNGEWSHTLTNLQLGANSVKLAQYVDDAHVSGDQTLDVPLTIRDLTVDHNFGSAVTDDVELSGKAEGNAGIVITDADGKETTTKANAAGVWSAPVPAPGAGQQTFTVVQRVHNMDSAPATETVDYGKALAVTSPEDGDKVTEGQDIHFEGTAQRGSKVEITDNGATTPFTSSNPIVTGYWDAYARSITAGENKYTMTQTTKGNLKQVDTLTVNKGDSNEVAPVTITNPAKVTDGYDANKAFTFKGKARAGSEITVQNVKGFVLGQNIPVNAQGEWEWTYANMKTTTWQLDFIADKGQTDQQTAELRNFKPKP